MDAYAILNITASSTPLEIKQAYKLALLNNHPDKCTDSKYSIDEINRAYKYLQNNDTQQVIHEPPQFSEILDLSELEEVALNSNEYYWVKPCRCGSEFKLTEHELETNTDADEIAVNCLGCSLTILVQYTVE